MAAMGFDNSTDGLLSVIMFKSIRYMMARCMRKLAMATTNIIRSPFFCVSVERSFGYSASKKLLSAINVG
jgi:hypothetical protein